jgi:hypothetical protein
MAVTEALAIPQELTCIMTVSAFVFLDTFGVISIDINGIIWLEKMKERTNKIILPNN